MSLYSHPAVDGIRFIGDCLAMVAYGSSGAAGLLEPSVDFGEVSSHSHEDDLASAVPVRSVAECLGSRLEIHQFRGC